MSQFEGEIRNFWIVGVPFIGAGTVFRVFASKVPCGILAFDVSTPKLPLMALSWHQANHFIICSCLSSRFLFFFLSSRSFQTYICNRVWLQREPVQCTGNLFQKVLFQESRLTFLPTFLNISQKSVGKNFSLFWSLFQKLIFSHGISQKKILATIKKD